jgi:hypothetical protein
VGRARRNTLRVRVDGLDHPGSSANDDPHRFERVLDGSSPKRRPKNGERLSLEAASHDDRETLVRAKRLDAFLEAREVPNKFRAIVDWLEQPDGGRHTVGT